MSDLNDEGRSLFDAARAGYEPSEGDRKRVLNGVLLRAGVVAGVTSAATAGAAAGAPLAAGTASPGVAGLLLKAAIWLAVGGSVGVSGYAVSRLRSSAVHATQVGALVSALGPSTHSPSALALATPGAASAAPATELPGPPESPALPRPSTALPALSAPLSRSAHDKGTASRAVVEAAPAVAAFPGAASPSAAPAASVSDLALSVEARALAQVQSDLKEGRNAHALRLVEEQRQQFAHGELQQERDAVRIVALCAVGRVADARAAAQDFLARSPRSPFAARIRASCAGP